jgi:hypothetical protein
MKASPPKQFNISGPCDPARHYVLPARLRLPDVQRLIDREEYFFLCGPSNSGRTTAMKAAADRINREDSHCAVYCSLEALAGADDWSEAMKILLPVLLYYFSSVRSEDLLKCAGAGFPAEADFITSSLKSPLSTFLSIFSAGMDKDLAVFFDDADCLDKQFLLSFLLQLQDGFEARPEIPSPRSIVLGMNTPRDCQGKRPGSWSLDPDSPFRILSEVLILPDFTVREVKSLYGQHTEASGLIFEDEAVQRAWYWSEGQPWLVNGLARQAVEKISSGDGGPPATARLIDQAAGCLMERSPHLDFLISCLQVPEVKRIIEPRPASSEEFSLNDETCGSCRSFHDDLEYCLDLGLVKLDGGDRIRPANPFFADVITRFFNGCYSDRGALLSNCGD